MRDSTYLTLWGRRALDTIRGEADFDLVSCLTKLTDAEFNDLLDAIPDDLDMKPYELHDLRMDGRSDAREAWDSSMNATAEHKFNRTLSPEALEIIGLGA